MVQISIPKQFERSRKFVAIPVREYEAFLKLRQSAHQHHESTTHRVFTKRPLAEVQTELADAHPDDPQLVADVMAGLKRSSLYAKRSAAVR